MFCLRRRRKELRLTTPTSGRLRACQWGASVMPREGILGREEALQYGSDAHSTTSRAHMTKTSVEGRILHVCQHGSLLTCI